VSDQLRRLEAQVGAKLLFRTTRRLSLTEAGVACLEHGERMVEAARAAADAASELHGEARGVLRLAAPTGLGQRRVVPAVANMQRAHPQLRVELSLSAGIADLVAERFDLAVRIGDLPDSRLVAQRLGTQQPALYAAPDYLRRRGTPRKAEDLARQDMLEFTPLGWRGLWQLHAGRRRYKLRAAPALATDCGEALLSAARNGMGIAAMPDWLVAEALAAGELVEVLPGWQTRAVPINAVYRDNQRVPAKTQLALRYLKAQFAAG
jgi:DNA-binding transcriptional LysR family regulator